MQIYALDKNGHRVRAKEATRHTDYQCLECKKTVRLRRGEHRQQHFYHSKPSSACRQSGKSLTHLHLQYFLQRLVGAQLEVSFPTIGRIADCLWEEKKLVFEVQCSPISSEELLARNRDYKKLGLQTIWVLHDKRFNSKNLSSAEHALKSWPHYYTNMSSEGSGMIYDHFTLDQGARRLARSCRLPVQLNLPLEPPPIASHLESFARPWPLAFAGDLNHSLSLQSERLLESLDRLQKWAPSTRPKPQWWKVPYRILFRYLLEKVCN